MQVWIIVGAILAFFAIFFISGYILFVFLKRDERKLMPEIAKLEALQDERNDFLLDAIERISDFELSHSYDFAQLELEKEQDLLSTRDRQDMAFLVIRKLIQEEVNPTAELEEILTAVDVIKDKSEQVYESYNKAARNYNVLFNTPMTRIFTKSTKRHSYPYIR